MRHENSVFHQLQQHIPWGVFDRLVDEHKADHRVRRLNTKSQLLALLFGQLAGAASLRDIEAGLISQKTRLYHVGGRTIARTTLADANARRPAAVFAGLFAHMAAAALRRTRRHMRDSVRILDATRIKLSALVSSRAGESWADMVGGKKAIKVHLTYDPLADLPMEASITGQKTNDIVVGHKTEILPGVTYVFDLAYYDFGWWAKIDQSSARFVTRLKTNTPLTICRTTRFDGDARRQDGILEDTIGHLPERLARSRCNPFQDPVRVVTVKLETGAVIRIVTNDLDAPVEEIADLYKQRWQIELFFKWIKQNLDIRHFLGRSENAVRIQIYVALITHILLRMAQATQDTIHQPLAFTRLVRLNLTERRSIKVLRDTPTTSPQNQRQLTLPLAGT